ncbi:MAG: enoyl-CoA hydratase [Pseudomonadota bacterium]
MVQVQQTQQPQEAGVSYEIADGVVTLTLARPEKYNTLTRAVLAGLQIHLDAIAQSDAARVVIIESQGKAFSTGHDLKEMAANEDKAFYEELFAECAHMMQSIVALPQPVIAKVQGIATAAGCQLVASCDLAIATASARFATNGIANGLYCATPQVALSRVVSRKHALEMLLTGDFISAQRAYEIGLVNRVAADGQLDQVAADLAQRIASHSQAAMRIGKASFYRQINQPLDVAYIGTSNDLVCNLLTEDGQEGLDAFINKRKPVWKDK